MRSAIGGIAVVSDVLPHNFIMLQDTTTARPALRGKLTNEDGDMAKAVPIISPERERAPTLA